MKITKEHFKLSEILAAMFTGSQNEQDELEFEEWVEENARHKALADRLLDAERYEEHRRALLKFQAGEVWENVNRRLGPKGRRMAPWKWILSSAALIFVFLSVGVYYWWGGTDVEKPSGIMYQIAAGTTGARLTLGDGRTVDVVKDRVMELQEVDGTMIVTDSTGIDYSAREAVDHTEVINTVQTFTGMEYTLTLSDGSRVYLNAETVLTFPTKFTGKQRVVEIEGEAYFDVRKDAERPFIVKSGAIDIRVLGTSFNVRSYKNEGDIVTTLVQGKVAVSDGNVQKTITPGEQAIYMKEAGKMEVREVDVSLYTAWHLGKFVFRNETLEDMLVSLSRWYGFKYRFIDDRAKLLQLGAHLDRYDNMNPIIEMLRETGLVNVTQVDDMLYISSSE